MIDFRSHNFKNVLKFSYAHEKKNHMWEIEFMPPYRLHFNKMILVSQISFVKLTIFIYISKILMNAFRALVNNSFKEIFYEKKKEK